jgi:hypothetical protein
LISVLEAAVADKLAGVVGAVAALAAVEKITP